jgi:hypothetical protein
MGEEKSVQRKCVAVCTAPPQSQTPSSSNQRFWCLLCAELCLCQILLTNLSGLHPRLPRAQYLEETNHVKTKIYTVSPTLKARSSSQQRFIVSDVSPSTVSK